MTFASADAGHPPTFTINNGTTNTGVGSSTVLNYTGDTITSATTTIGINTLDANGNPIYSPTGPGWSTVFIKVGQHEMGHSMGENDVTGSNQTPGSTVMNQIHGTNDSQNYLPTTIKGCDNQTVDKNNEYMIYQGYDPGGGGGGGGGQCGVTPGPGAVGGSGTQRQPSQQGGVQRDDRCTPIIIDTTGTGFQLTDTAHGVSFDILANGHPQ